MKNERARVLELRARNVKCVKEVVIDRLGDIHEIRGDSGQGKTTILDSIRGALEGLDPELVRQGSSSAEVELVLSTARVQRICGSDGSEQLYVTDSAGCPVEKAKEFLKTIAGGSAFNPVAWVQLGGGEKKGRTERLRRQRDQLLEALPMELGEADIERFVRDRLGLEYLGALGEVNLDGVEIEQHPFVVLAGIEKACYEFRKVVNGRVEEAERLLGMSPAPELGAPGDSLSSLESAATSARERYWQAKGAAGNRAKLASRRDELSRKVAEDLEELPERSKVERTLEHWRGESGALRDAVEELERELSSRKEELRSAEVKAEEAERLLDRWSNHAARVEDLASLDAELGDDGSGPDLGVLEDAMRETEELLARQRQQDAHDEAATRLASEQLRSSVFTELVGLFRDEFPKALLAGTQLPVEGLGIEGDHVTIGGVPLHQLGTSEQIRVGVAIASALNPRAGFVLVDRAESLGREDRLALAKSAGDLGLQLIMTYVDPDAAPGEGVTVMRDGASVGRRD